MYLAKVQEMSPVDEERFEQIVASDLERLNLKHDYLVRLSKVVLPYPSDAVPALYFMIGYCKSDPVFLSGFATYLQQQVKSDLAGLAPLFEF